MLVLLALLAACTSPCVSAQNAADACYQQAGGIGSFFDYPCASDDVAARCFADTIDVNACGSADGAAAQINAACSACGGCGAASGGGDTAGRGDTGYY